MEASRKQRGCSGAEEGEMSVLRWRSLQEGVELIFKVFIFFSLRRKVEKRADLFVTCPPPSGVNTVSEACWRD